MSLGSVPPFGVAAALCASDASFAATGCRTTVTVQGAPATTCADTLPK
jgi:hypothetical protein